ncbi:MAG: hypothetical protein GX811_02835 [Lentisphaerae bacterium]|nr:hypothetical protein [Lentisphaerota bacterium]
MYYLTNQKITKIDPITFSELDLREENIEEMLRKNIDMLCDEEESLLVVGQQVQNASSGRSDLTAIDNNGNLVLIEIKRDLKDIVARKEAFEFQAIRYAASYGTILSVDHLVHKIYAPYIEKYKDEFDLSILTAHELASRKLIDFLEANEAESTFNQKQRIILVASAFDEQTLSAVAWMNNNGVDISCFKLVPYQLAALEETALIGVEKILPVPQVAEFYLNLLDKRERSSVKSSIKRRVLPKIATMLEWGVVKPGDTIVAKDRENEAQLQANGNVLVDGVEQSMQAWLKEIFGWSSIQTYVFAVHKETGKTLYEIREEYMEKGSDLSEELP